MALPTFIASENKAPYTISTLVRRVKLFKNGTNQAVRIPREFEFDAQEVSMRRVGNALVLEPIHTMPKRGTAAALAQALREMAAWGPIDEEFPDVDEGFLPLDDIDFGVEK